MTAEERKQEEARVRRLWGGARDEEDDTDGDDDWLDEDPFAFANSSVPGKLTGTVWDDTPEHQRRTAALGRTLPPRRICPELDALQDEFGGIEGELVGACIDGRGVGVVVGDDEERATRAQRFVDLVIPLCPGCGDAKGRGWSACRECNDFAGGLAD